MIKMLIWTLVGAIFLYVVVLIALFFGQEKILFLDEQLPDNHVFRFDNTEEINLQTKDGALLNALHFKLAQNSKGLILYFHGNAGSIEKWGAIVEPLMKYGYDLLLVDYRGYGKSRGERTAKALYSDAILWLKEAEKRKAQGKLLIYGRSLGCTFASYTAAQNSADALILESPFHSLRSIVKNKYPIFPANFLLHFRFPSYQYFEKVQKPILLFHGTDDEVVPFSEGQALAASNPRTQFVSIQNGHHNDLAKYDEYWNSLSQFLKALE